MTDRTRLLLAPSGELHTKAPRTRRRFRERLRANLDAALAHADVAGRVRDDGRRLLADVADAAELDRAGQALARVFGVRRVTRAIVLPEHTLDGLVAAAAAHAGPWVRGRTFAVRVARRGDQPWSSGQAEGRLGAALLDRSAGVDLDAPQVTVRVDAYGDQAYLSERAWDGPRGLPLGTQEPVLALLSGGFDSPVAAWSLMRRGCPVHVVHFRFDCASAEHALLSAHLLWRRWGAGSDPLAWVVDFEPVRAALGRVVPRRLRQVVLRRLMLAAADAVAERAGIGALATGEAVGQVSSQTLPHLRLADDASARPVLRPLVACDKQDIIDRSRALGLADLSVQAREVCDLAGPGVAVAARASTVAAAERDLPPDLVERVVAARRVVRVRAWQPGMDPQPAAAAPVAAAS